jgi:hypothetical protein
LCIPNAYILDLIVDGKVVVEGKAVDCLKDVHVAQVNSYLRFSGLEVGLLLNFRAWPLKEGLKRVVNTKVWSFFLRVSAPPRPPESAFLSRYIGVRYWPSAEASPCKKPILEDAERRRRGEGKSLSRP